MACRDGERRRCRVCRGWFREDVRVGERQKVCSKACQKVRRRGQARSRRQQDLAVHREAERERQQVCRARKRTVTAAVVTAVVTPELLGATAELVGTAATAARAGDERKARKTELSRPDRERVSRAEMPPQGCEKMDEILLCWDRQARLSRAKFERQVARILGERGASLRQLGP